MQCIERLSYSSGTYRIHARNLQGQLSPHPITSLPTLLCDEGAGDKQLAWKGQTSLQTWAPLTNDELTTTLKTLGFSPQSADQLFGQSVYRFTDGQQQALLIPIGVLICALFRPFPGMSRYLLAPHGLDNLILPLDDSSKPEIRFYESARGNTGLQIDKAEGILNSLSWMYCFPSARRAWNSVLEYARQGRLDMKLPIGDFSFYGRGISVGNQTLITELTIKLLDTTEEPYPAHSLHTKVIEFQRISLSERPKTHAITKENHLPRRPCEDGYSLSDEEWQALQPLMEKPNLTPRQFSLRTVIDKILYKLGHGISWANVPGLSFSTSLLPRTYSRMQKDGRWQLLMNCLQQSRPSERREISAVA